VDLCRAKAPHPESSQGRMSAPVSAHVQSTRPCGIATCHVEHLGEFGKSERPQRRVGTPMTGLVPWPGWAQGRVETPHGRVELFRSKTESSQGHVTAPVNESSRGTWPCRISARPCGFPEHQKA